MCLQRPIYDVIIGNVPGARAPERLGKKWKPDDDEVFDGPMCKERTDTQTGMAATRAQVKREKQRYH